MSEASSHDPAMFGSMVFNEKVMKERLPKDTYKALKKCKDEGIPLDMSVAPRSTPMLLLLLQRQ